MAKVASFITVISVLCFVLVSFVYGIGWHTDLYSYWTVNVKIASWELREALNSNPFVAVAEYLENDEVPWVDRIIGIVPKFFETCSEFFEYVMLAGKNLLPWSVRHYNPHYNVSPYI